MVLPLRLLLTRGAMGKRFTGGGVPLGESAVSAGSAPAARSTPLSFFGCATTGDPARSVGDTPNSDKSLRRFSFMLLPPSRIEKKSKFWRPIILTEAIG